MLTILAFLLALGLLIAIHEYGHFQVARWCGVKVLRFSVGFGKPLWRWQPRDHATEYVLGMLPLGGYVKMLDEREGPVAPSERHLAFNTQPVGKRFLIVLAGPMANLLLAIGLYAGMAWHGLPEAAPVVAAPPAGSLAALAGVQSGDTVTGLRWAAHDTVYPVSSLEQLRWQLARAALEQEDVVLQVRRSPGAGVTELLLRLSEGRYREADAAMMEKIGIGAPWMAPVVGDVVAGEPAQAAGLMKNDKVIRLDSTPVQDAVQLRQQIQGQLDGRPHVWQVERQGQILELPITAQITESRGARVARVGAYLGEAPAMVTVRYGFLQALEQGVEHTWQVGALSLKMMGRMLVGQASVKNLSGPLTIAEYAGRSAQAGLGSYVVFLALISVSLGVLNLLPVPLLDGGHLMYYLWEAVTGKPVTDAWMERLQRVGIAFLATLMAIAIFNDISRQLG